MIPLKIKVTGNMLEKLRSRLVAWQSLRRMASTIVVDATAAWWYWQEFGTASKKDAGGVPYPIFPVDATKLVFPVPGGVAIRDSVLHPGIRPAHMVESTLPQIHAELGKNIHAAFLAGAPDNPDILRHAVNASAQDAKQLIVESIAIKVPGTRSNTQFPNQDGRLHGATAASVFEEAAVIAQTGD